MGNVDNTKVCFKGEPVKISGSSVSVGGKLPNCRVSNSSLKDVNLRDFAGKVLIVSAIPSIDTPVCAQQTRSFNRAATELSDQVQIVSVSMDLPFALTRWCGQEGVERLLMTSDYKHREFGDKFGCYLPDLGLLTRAIFITDKTGVIRYVEYVQEVTSEPNYNDALTVVRELLA